jgi:hypothetical protein
MPPLSGRFRTRWASTSLGYGCRPRNTAKQHRQSSDCLAWPIDHSGRSKPDQRIATSRSQLPVIRAGATCNQAIGRPGKRCLCSRCRDSTLETSRIRMAFCWPVATTFAKRRALDGKPGIPWPGPMLATRGYMGLPDAVLERGRQADAPVKTTAYSFDGSCSLNLFVVAR